MDPGFKRFLTCMSIGITTYFLTGSYWHTAVLAYAPSYFCGSEHTGERRWDYFVNLKIWKIISNYFDGEIVVDGEYDENKQYIVGAFPHGACTINHMLLMTDNCQFLSKHFKNDRRDLAARVLFAIPLVREILLWLGNVDACSETAVTIIREKKQSLFIYVGGEREQLLNQEGKHIVFLNHRKGFVKLAVRYGIELVPLYAFGEVDLYSTSDIFHNPRMWLVKTLQIAIPLFWGRFGTIIPYKKKIAVVMGKPIPVKKIEDPTPEQIDELHAKFEEALKDLFDRHKEKYDCADKELIIV